MDFILSIMEVEAWFLAEYPIFQTLIPKSPCLRSSRHGGFVPINDDMQLRLTADDMNHCYAIGGKTYEKRNAQQTVAVSTTAHVYAGLVDKFPYLKKLCDIITAFLKAQRTDVALHI